MRRDYPTQVCVHPTEVPAATSRLPLVVMAASGREPAIFEGRVDLERLYRELGRLGADEP